MTSLIFVIGIFAATGALSATCGIYSAIVNRDGKTGSDRVELWFLPVMLGVTMLFFAYSLYSGPYQRETAATAQTVYDKWVVKVDAHSWYDEESSTLYVDSAWDRTILDMADDIAAALHDDADFEAKYETAVRETLSDKEFAAWQASQEAQRDVIFTLTNGRRYDVRHVVDINTGDVIR